MSAFILKISYPRKEIPEAAELEPRILAMLATEL